MDKKDANNTPDPYSDLEEFPLLEDVVIEGDPGIIESSRREYEQIKVTDDFELDSLSKASPQFISQLVTDKQLEALVDEIIEAHTEKMRADILKVIKHILDETRNPSEK